ncbi:MAG: hypothetical protein FJX25_01045 [Alphaproteobacteria bacterium]|nr:hypothetical protein [Alphaproteobacteria bacterium]
MTESYSRRRQEAEIAFGKTQSPRTARDRAFDEIDAIKAADEEKTLRLREARLARDAQDKATPKAGPGAKRTRNS